MYGQVIDGKRENHGEIKEREKFAGEKRDFRRMCTCVYRVVFDIAFFAILIICQSHMQIRIGDEYNTDSLTFSSQREREREGVRYRKNVCSPRANKTAVINEKNAKEQRVIDKIDNIVYVAMYIVKSNKDARNFVDLLSFIYIYI